MAGDKIEDALRELERENRLLPADVVEKARDPDSPLHSHFEWDNTAAAEKYRLVQARTLIRTVKLMVTVHDVPVSVSYYVRDPEADAQQAGYRSVVSLRSEEDAARNAVIDAMKRVSNAVRHAKELAAVLGVAGDLETIDSLARGVSRRIEAEGPSATQ
jgi:hypothetical protein